MLQWVPKNHDLLLILIIDTFQSLIVELFFKNLAFQFEYRIPGHFIYMSLNKNGNHCLSTSFFKAPRNVSSGAGILKLLRKSSCWTLT